MKFTLKWLQQHLELPLNYSIEKLCKTLDNIGLEVESIDNNSQKYDNFSVAEILSAETHPNADSLRVCRVNDGNRILNIVCGAPNARAGIKVILANIGAIVPNGSFEIKKSKIRGIESEGMLCSATELELGEDSNGIVELPENAMIGQTFAEHAGLNDITIEIALTPNRRRDCASVYGIARDLASAGVGKLKEISISNKQFTSASTIQVEILAKKECSQFNYFTCENIQQSEIENKNFAFLKNTHDCSLVNLSNFIMFSCGNPNHIYDANKIVGNKIYVKLSEGNEKFVAIGGKEYILPQGILIICDAEKVLCVAGVMGSELSKVDENTTNILVEIANFCSKAIAFSSQTLNIFSDSKYRFESGIDWASIDITSRILQSYFATASAIESVYGNQLEYVKTLFISINQIEKGLGISVNANEILNLLKNLSYEPEMNTENSFKLFIPTWKQGNVETYHDVIDDLLRMGLMEKVNSANHSRRFTRSETVHLNMMSSVTENSFNNMNNSRIIQNSTAYDLQQTLIGRGMHECLTWSFYSDENKFSIDEYHIQKYILNSKSYVSEKISIINPINNNFTCMRRTIAYNLLHVISKYPNNQEEKISLFEMGNIYGNSLQEFQTMTVCGLRASKKNLYSFFDVREDLLALLKAFGMSDSIYDYSYDSQVPDYYHSTRSIRIKLGNIVLGICGELHPTLLNNSHSNTAIFELFTCNIPSKYYKVQSKKALTLSNHQRIQRDLAFIISNDINVGEIVKTIHSLKEKNIENVKIFDVYSEIQQGKKSVALSIFLQPTFNMTENDISSIMNKVINSIEERHNGILRDNRDSATKHGA